MLINFKKAMVQSIAILLADNVDVLNFDLHAILADLVCSTAAPPLKPPTGSKN